jgi:hypothetical protein
MFFMDENLGVSYFEVIWFLRRNRLNVFVVFVGLLLINQLILCGSIHSRRDEKYQECLQYSKVNTHDHNCYAKAAND